jgi:hypothetical protein
VVRFGLQPCRALSLKSISHTCFPTENISTFYKENIGLVNFSFVIIVLFVETPRKVITAKLSIRKPGSSSVLINIY